MALTKIGKEGITGISNSANANAITVDSGENVALSGTLGVTGAITGTLATAAQPNITSVGTLTSFRSTGIDDNADALAITIDTSENVGIGMTPNTNYTKELNILGSSTNARIKIANSSTGSSNTDGFDLIADGTGAYVWNRENDILVFATNNAEKVRLDASGNLLLATTNASPANGNVQGTAIKTNNAQFSANGNNAITANRMTSDGDIVILKKAGTTVGSIGVTSGDQIYIGRSTGSQGIKLKNSALLPSSNAGADADASKDLGSSSARWQSLYLSSDINNGTNSIAFSGGAFAGNGSGNDANIDLGRADRRFESLYLSSGVFLGGTTSANQLDDYEEGTWSPQIYAGANITTSNITANYTKIGKFVSLQAQFKRGSSSGGGNTLLITGLPFAHGPGSGMPGNAWIDNVGTDLRTMLYIDNGATSIYFTKTGATSAYVSINEWENGRWIYLYLNYRRAS